MNRLRTRLIAVFILATLAPLGLTLWTALRLLDRSLDLAPLDELAEVTESLEKTGRELYQQSRETLKEEAAAGKVQPRQLTPQEAKPFLERGEPEMFELAGAQGNRLDYYVRQGDGAVVYSRQLEIPMAKLTEQIAGAKQALEQPVLRDFRRGFSLTLVVIMAGLWVAALVALVFLGAHITRPVQQLTQGLSRVAAGDLSTRVPADGSDEIAAALDAFNRMAEQLQQARERLIQVTRLASWQALARKMAHEVKNSLTPIRLTMEEVASRSGATDPAFLEQAAQIVVDEVTTLEKRVRAFSDFASEPPVSFSDLDLNSIVEERVSLLKSAHPDVIYQLQLAPGRPCASADADLVKSELTNLLENAGHAAQPGGVVMVRTRDRNGMWNIEVHDSGPGLSMTARSTLFEPTISFKKGGMGLGLSIARRSAVLCGGDLEAFEGELGGAGFRLILGKVAAANPARAASNGAPVEV